MSQRDIATRADEFARFWARNQRAIAVGGMCAVIVLALIAWALRDYMDDSLPLAGYPGVFILSLIGSASIVFPAPAFLSVCVLSVELNPVYIGVLHGVGESMGEWTGYVLGHGGNSLFERLPFYRRLRPILSRWMLHRRGTVLLIVVSCIPNPIFDFVGIAAGGVRYPFGRFMAIVFVGKIIKGLLIAYTCHFGITALPWVA